MKKGKRPLPPGDQALWEMVKTTAEPLPDHMRNLASGTAAPNRLQSAMPEPPVPAMEKGKKSVSSPVKNSSSTAPPREIGARPMSGFDEITLKKLKRGRMRVDARLDLHGLTQDAARTELLNFLQVAYWSETRLVLVITGRGNEGNGVLRRNVPRWLAAPPFSSMVSGVNEATARHGGDGALYVRLRRRKVRNS